MKSGGGRIRIFEVPKRHIVDPSLKVIPRWYLLVSRRIYVVSRKPLPYISITSGTPVFGSGFWVALPAGVQGGKGSDRCKSRGDRSKPWRCAQNPSKSL